MSAPYIYSGPPGRGFEPGALYDLAYPPAGDGWEPVATVATPPADLSVSLVDAEAPETTKENS